MAVTLVAVGQSQPAIPRAGNRGPACSPGGARVGRHDAARHPAQRRGADAAGGRADRARPGAVPRLLVVLSARPAVPARRRCARCSGRRCCTWRIVRVLDRRHRGRAGLRLAAGGPRRRTAPRARRVGGGDPRDGVSRAGRTRSRSRSRCVLGALLPFERRPVLAGVLVGVCAAWRLEFALFAAAGILLLGRAPSRLGPAAAATGARSPPAVGDGGGSSTRPW